MALRQISVFLENRPGTLVEITDILRDSLVNILAVNLPDTSKFGILRLIVDKPDLCAQVLKEHGKMLSVVRILAVRVPDHPGGFGDMVRVLTENGHNIDYVYHFSQHGSPDACVILRTDELDAAETLLISKGYEMCEE